MTEHNYPDVVKISSNFLQLQIWITTIIYTSHLTTKYLDHDLFCDALNYFLIHEAPAVTVQSCVLAFQILFLILCREWYLGLVMNLAMKYEEPILQMLEGTPPPQCGEISKGMICTILDC